MLEELVSWFVGDFFPVGDLISDIWLLTSLPAQRPPSMQCSDETYRLVRGLLGVGTVIDAIPEMALLFAILAGVSVLLVLGPAYMSTGRNEKELRGIASGLWSHVRHTPTDGKSIVNFIFHDTKAEQSDGPSLATLVDKIAWITLVVPHLPYLWILRTCFGGAPYHKIITAQVLGGAVTEVASIFFAVVSGETVAIVSSAFGMYSLLISTVVAWQRGLAVTEAREPTKAVACDREEEWGGGDDVTERYRTHRLAKCFPSFDETRNGWVASYLSKFLAAVLILGVPTTSFLGVHFYQSGSRVVLGCVLMAFGFGFWLFLIFAYHRNEGGDSDMALVAFFISVPSVMLILGLYWYASSTAPMWLWLMSIVVSVLWLFSACLGVYTAKPDAPVDDSAHDMAKFRTKVAWKENL